MCRVYRSLPQSSAGAHKLGQRVSRQYVSILSCFLPKKHASLKQVLHLTSLPPIHFTKQAPQYPPKGHIDLANKSMAKAQNEMSLQYY